MNIFCYMNARNGGAKHRHRQATHLKKLREKKWKGNNGTKETWVVWGWAEFMAKLLCTVMSVLLLISAAIRRESVSEI
jgi:hypothetical protein